MRIFRCFLPFQLQKDDTESQIDSKGKNAKLPAVVACCSQHILRLEADFNMLYELVQGLAKSSQSLVSLPNISTGYVRVAVKGEETVQQVHENMANGKAALNLSSGKHQERSP